MSTRNFCILSSESWNARVLGGKRDKDMSMQAQIRHWTDRFWDVIVDLMVWKEIALLLWATRAWPFTKTRRSTEAQKTITWRINVLIWWKIRHNDTPHIHATCNKRVGWHAGDISSSIWRSACNDPGTDIWWLDNKRLSTHPNQIHTRDNTYNSPSTHHHPNLESLNALSIPNWIIQFNCITENSRRKIWHQEWPQNFLSPNLDPMSIPTLPGYV